MPTVVLLALVFVSTFQGKTAPPANTQQSKATESATTRAVDLETASQLAKVKRIYVESFGDDKDAKQLQAMVIDALVATKRFIVTENKEKADAILKGAGLEKTSQEFHAISEGTSVGAAGGSSSGSVSGSDVNGTGSVSGSSSGGFAATHLGIEDSQASNVTVNDARLVVRLVSVDGDVLWSTTQESKAESTKAPLPTWPIRSPNN